MTPLDSSALLQKAPLKRQRAPETARVHAPAQNHPAIGAVQKEARLRAYQHAKQAMVDAAKRDRHAFKAVASPAYEEKAAETLRAIRELAEVDRREGIKYADTFLRLCVPCTDLQQDGARLWQSLVLGYGSDPHLVTVEQRQTARAHAILTAKKTLNTAPDFSIFKDVIAETIEALRSDKTPRIPGAAGPKTAP